MKNIIILCALLVSAITPAEPNNAMRLVATGVLGGVAAGTYYARIKIKNTLYQCFNPEQWAVNQVFFLDRLTKVTPLALFAAGSAALWQHKVFKNNEANNDSLVNNKLVLCALATGIVASTALSFKAMNNDEATAKKQETIQNFNNLTAKLKNLQKDVEAGQHLSQKQIFAAGAQCGIHQYHLRSLIGEVGKEENLYADTKVNTARLQDVLFAVAEGKKRHEEALMHKILSR